VLHSHTEDVGVEVDVTVGVLVPVGVTVGVGVGVDTISPQHSSKLTLNVFEQHPSQSILTKTSINVADKPVKVHVVPVIFTQLVVPVTVESVRPV
jgi:hypothetical protein